MVNIKTHLRTLVRLALVDQHFADVEKEMIYKIGKANKLDKGTVDDLIKEEFTRTGGNEPLEFNALSFDERFDYLFNIIQLMKVDHEIFLSEIKFCEEMAEKLGFNKGAVHALSPKIHADPGVMVLGALDDLKRELKEYEK